MVTDETTDGRRIAALLASELTGLSTGGLGAVRVVDADRDVSPTPAGAFAYAIERADDRVGSVEVRHEAAVVTLPVPVPALDAVDRPDLTVEGPGGRQLVVERGAAVKAAVDVLAATLVE